MSSLLADLWHQAEKQNELTAPLVDAVTEHDPEYGAMLLWCFENGRWPGFEIGAPPHLGYWFVQGSFKQSLFKCYRINWVGIKELPRRKSTREAFDDLYMEWKKLTPEHQCKGPK